MARKITTELDVVGQVYKKDYSYKYNYGNEYDLFLKLTVGYAGFQRIFTVNLETYDRYGVGDDIAVKLVTVEVGGKTQDEHFAWSKDAGVSTYSVIVDDQPHLITPKDKELIKRFNLK